MGSIWITVLAMLVSTTANATLSGQFHAGFKDALETLAQLQVSKLGMKKGGGAFPIADRLTSQIRYLEVPTLAKPAGATRRSAFASCEKHTVYISRSEATGKPIPLPIIIHESLGALCIVDTNYEMTSILSLMIESKRKGFRTQDEMNTLWHVSLGLLNRGSSSDRLMENLAEQSAIQSANSVMIDGSATSIGSAGDALSAEIKFLFLKDYLRWLDPESYQFSKRVKQAILNVKIERVAAGNGKIRYVRVLDKKRVYGESFYFYVPRQMSTRQAADEIFNFMKTRLGYGPNFRAKGTVPHLGN